MAAGEVVCPVRPVRWDLYAKLATRILACGIQLPRGQVVQGKWLANLEAELFTTLDQVRRLALTYSVISTGKAFVRLLTDMTKATRGLSKTGQAGAGTPSRTMTGKTRSPLR